MVESLESQEGHPAEFENKIFRGIKVKQWSEGTKGREKMLIWEGIGRKTKRKKRETEGGGRGFIRQLKVWVGLLPPEISFHCPYCSTFQEPFRKYPLRSNEKRKKVVNTWTKSLLRKENRIVFPLKIWKGRFLFFEYRCELRLGEIFI